MHGSITAVGNTDNWYLFEICGRQMLGVNTRRSWIWNWAERHLCQLGDFSGLQQPQLLSTPVRAHIHPNWSISVLKTIRTHQAQIRYSTQKHPQDVCTPPLLQHYALSKRSDHEKAFTSYERMYFSAYWARVEDTKRTRHTLVCRETRSEDVQGNGLFCTVKNIMCIYTQFKHW